MKLLLCCLLLAAPLAAQRDFLNADEIQGIRDAQEPNLRLKLYADYARARLDLVTNMLHKDKSARSVMIHDALEDYGKILDAIDTVADAAAMKKTDIGPGLAEVAKMYEAMLPELQKVRESKPKDLDRYEFALTQAIETTQDSLLLAKEDLSKRGTDAESREAKQKKAIEAEMRPAGEDKSEDKKSVEAAEPSEKPKRKPPTLLKPGEKAGAKKQ